MGTRDLDDGRAGTVFAGCLALAVAEACLLDCGLGYVLGAARWAWLRAVAIATVGCWGAWRRWCWHRYVRAFPAEALVLGRRCEQRCHMLEPYVLHARGTVLLLDGHGGGGHAAAADALEAALARCAPDVHVVRASLSELVEERPDNLAWRLTRCTGEDLYNWALARGGSVAVLVTVALAAAQRVAVCADAALAHVYGACGSARARWCTRVCATLFRRVRPDVVCNVTPGTAAFLRRGLEDARLGAVPLVTIVTDFDATGVHDWLADAEHTVVCGTPEAYMQARAAGVPEAHLRLVSGMLLHPSFYAGPSHRFDVPGRLAALGLAREQRTCVLCWGGVGSQRMYDVGRWVAALAHPLNLIFLCGRNARLVAALQRAAWPPGCRVYVGGHTPHMRDFLALADVLVCKPGPGVCTEAAFLGVPMLLDSWAWVLPQEASVCREMLRRGLAVGFSTRAHFVRQLRALLGMLPPGARGATVCAEVPPADNMAIFQAVRVLGEFLST